MRAAAITAMLAMGLVLVGCDSDRSTRATAPGAHNWEKEELAKKQEAQQLEELKQCTQDREKRVATYHEQMAKGDHWKAFLAVNRCASALDDAELQAMANKAEAITLTSQVKDKKLAASDRLRSLNRLQAIDAKQADKFSKFRDELVRATKHAEIMGKVAAFNNRRENIERHVSIGMSADQVMDEVLGTPDHINRSTSANGTTEQWVYGNGRYVYFRDGRVTTIQSGR